MVGVIEAIIYIRRHLTSRSDSSQMPHDCHKDTEKFQPVIHDNWGFQFWQLYFHVECSPHILGFKFDN